MQDAALLRLVSIGGAVLLAGVAALLMASVVRTSSRAADSRRWWVPILGFVVSLVIVYLGYQIFANGYTWTTFS